MKKTNCKFCGYELDKFDAICPACLKKQGKIKKCGNCKEIVLANEKICPICGSSKKQTAYMKQYLKVICVITFVLLLIFAENIRNNMIEDKFDVNSKQSKEIKETLKEIGITNINKIERQQNYDDYYSNGGKDKGYKVSNSNDKDITTKSIIININEDGTILIIRDLENNILYENGSIKNTLDKN